VQEPLHRGRVSLFCQGLKLVVLSTEASAPHQVSHQSDIFVCICHISFSSI
jgi:hypothetical protein